MQPTSDQGAGAEADELASLQADFPQFRIWREAHMTQPPPPDNGLTASLARWREAWRIRRAHPKWVVQRVAPTRQYQAFRLSQIHRDAVLTAGTPEGVTAQIERAEQAEQAEKARRAARRTARPVKPSRPPTGSTSDN